MRRTTSEELYSVFEGCITLHNSTYRDEFVKCLGWKVVSCHERSLAAGIFWGLLTLFQTHLPQFLPCWRCLCQQGFLLRTLSSTLGSHNRNPWPGCFVPSPIQNILLVCFLLAHCYQISVMVYHNMGVFLKWNHHMGRGLGLFISQTHQNSILSMMFINLFVVHFKFKM